MTLVRGRRLALTVLLALAPIGLAPPAAAQESAKTKADARRFFKSGQKAFASGRFEEAARAFEEAFRLAPHPAPLINAGDSYEKSGELARAARSYQRVLEFDEAAEQDRQDATDRLAKLTPKLAIIQFEGSAEARLRVDEEEYRGDQRVYLIPGEHDVLLLGVEGAKPQRLELNAGSTRTIEVDSLRPVKDRPRSATASKEPESDAPMDAGPSKKGGVRALTWVSLGVGVAAGGAAVYFGLQVNDAESKFNERPNREDFDRFNDNKLYTNISLGVSAVGVGLGTVLLIGDLGRKAEPEREARRWHGVAAVPLRGGGVVVGSGSF
ncbi:MAG: hypothetical protein KF718_11045 [Polyangiaceae bacterium]|nr:hypothetical protein [Polyangiaceae bacterium]